MRDQNTHDMEMRRKRLSLLLHLFLIHRYKAAVVHYLTPTEDNQLQAASMHRLGLFESVSDEVGEIIVADVNDAMVADLVAPRQRRAESDYRKAVAPDALRWPSRATGVRRRAARRRDRSQEWRRAWARRRARRHTERSAIPVGHSRIVHPGAPER